jgi:hypothetical protein
MASVHLVADRETEAEKVLVWRLEELEKAGFEAHHALELAERSDVDLHLAVALMRSGCPVGTALRILL